jgi:hypothetical protein
MMTTPFKYLILTVISLATFLVVVPVCTADVVVLDRVTTVKTPVRIAVLTKGRFFAAGGRLVDIYLDDKHLKRILTGGDGYGYLKYTPRSKGYKKIKARSNGDSAEGLLLVVTQKERAIVIEVEAGFKTAVFSDEIKQSSVQVVKDLSKTYKIIYLSRMAGRSVTGVWLEKQGFPRSVILKWQGANTLKALKKNGVQLAVIIGSPAVISAAVDAVEKRYTFDKTKDGTTVKNWGEIAKLLQ